MRKLLTAMIIAVTMAMAGTAHAAPNASKKAEVQFQKQRYYHALGYYRSIWNVAARTVYSPNLKVRHRWIGAARYLKRIQVNSLNAIHKLTAPPSLVPAGYPPHYSAWLCIHGYEGSWTDSGAPFWGGLQMDYGFQSAYGGDLLATKGTADHWTPLEQMWVAEKAWNSRGFYPWPNTARYCGLI
jgi:hypothetical protein